MTVIVSEREEQAFLAYVLDLARKEAPSQVRQDKSDETTMDGPAGPKKG